MYCAPLLRSLGVSFFLITGGFCETIRCFKLAEFIYRGGKKYAEFVQSPSAISLFWIAIVMTYHSRFGESNAAMMLKKMIESNEDFMAYYGLAGLYEYTDQRELAMVNYRTALKLTASEEWRSVIRSRLDRLHSGTSPPACEL
jgi:hypothetical protein